MRKILNVQILHTAKFFSDRGNWYSNEDIHKCLYGENWEKEMQNRSLDPDYYLKEHGFNKRYFVRSPGEKLTGKELTSADLMEGAALNLLNQSKVHKKEINLVIAVSTTTHRYTTSLGAIVAGRLGLKCASFEIKAGCSSAIYALFIASQFINSTGGKVLIVSAETLSKIASGQFFYVAGDGGAAVLLGYAKNKSKGIYSYYLDSDGSYSDKMGVPGILPPTLEACSDHEYLFKTSGDINFFISSQWKKIPNVLYKLSGIEPKKIKALIPHQVNAKMIEVVRKSAKIKKDFIINKVGEYGNCGQVSILIALHDAISEKNIQENDFIMLCAVGGGLAWGGMILKY